MLFFFQNAQMEYYFRDAIMNDSSYIEKSVKLFNKDFAGMDEEELELSYVETAIEYT